MDRRGQPFEGRGGDQRLQPLLGARVVADVQPVGVQCLAESIQLGSDGLDLALADLREELRANIAGEKPNDDHDHQQLEQGETFARCADSLHGECPRFM
jgi:hypothetical protein